MPLIIVAVRSRNASDELFKGIDRRMREEILDAAVLLDEQDKIPEDKLTVVVSPELERQDVAVEVTIAMLTRGEHQVLAYKHAAAVAIHKVGFCDKEMDIRFYGVLARNWK